MNLGRDLFGCINQKINNDSQLISKNLANFRLFSNIDMGWNDNSKKRIKKHYEIN